mgnify:CR=1 FL=1
MNEVRVNAAGVIAVVAMVVVGFGLANILAMRFAGHPAADAWLDLYGRGATAA